MIEVERMGSSAATVSTSGVEREPGEVTASRSPQRASSSTKARSAREVSRGLIMMCGVAGTLVLLHSFTQTRQSWRRTIAALDGRYYRVVAPDLPGHGQLAERRPVSLPAALAYLAALVAEPHVLAGYSMGGRIALHAALARPDLVRRLVLVGASPGLADPAERARRRAADEALADRIER